MATFTFGIVDGGRSPQHAQVHEFAQSIRQLDDPGADIGINIVFQLAGDISRPDWQGVHAVRLDRRRRAVLVNAAPDPGLVGEELDQFLVRAVRESVERAQQAIRRRKLDWSCEPHEEVAVRLEGPHVEQVLRLMRESAPRDVVATIDWLGASEWEPSRAWGGPPGWEGNAGLAVMFARQAWKIRVSRDRGQWMLDVHPAGWKSSVDLDIVLDAPAHRADWSQPSPADRQDQLPPGASWRRTLPEALTWLQHSPSREAEIHTLQQQEHVLASEAS